MWNGVESWRSSLVIGILRTLHFSGPLDARSIARKIEERGSSSVITQGSLYPVLNGLERGGLIRATWSGPQGKRMTKQFSLLPAGLRQLAREIVEREHLHSPEGASSSRISAGQISGRAARSDARRHRD